ncbi:MAG: fumarylacetoacetate hydrolase family protein [Actinomycetes bacterium]
MRIARVGVEGAVRFVDLGDENAREIDGHPFGEDELVFTGRQWPLAQLKLLAPVLPSKVIAVAHNYRAHAVETGATLPPEPMIFIKPSTSVIGPGDPIMRPRQSNRVDYEAELAVVIGRLCRDVPAERAEQVILGYTAANDVTARDLQASDGQWSRAKGFDTFCPLGPWIETDIDLSGPAVPGESELRVQCLLNGLVVQDSNTADMIFRVADLIAWISSAITLLPGDVILTGTPAGIGPMAAGDEVEVRIDGLGPLINPVIDRP